MPTMLDFVRSVDLALGLPVMAAVVVLILIVMWAVRRYGGQPADAAVAATNRDAIEALAGRVGEMDQRVAALERQVDRIATREDLTEISTEVRKLDTDNRVWGAKVQGQLELLAHRIEAQGAILNRVEQTADRMEGFLVKKGQEA